MNEIQNPKFESDLEIMEITGGLPAIKAEADALTIADDGTLVRSSDLRGSLKEMIQFVEKKRKVYTIPFNDVLRFINDSARAIVAPIKDVDVALDKKQRDYHRVLAQRRAEEDRKRLQEEAERQRKLDKIREKEQNAKSDSYREKLRLEREATEKVPMSLVTEVASSVKSEGGSQTIFKKEWKYRVVDVQKVPREFMVLDQVSVRKAIRDGVREIEGLEIYQETTTSVRKGRDVSVV